MCHVPAGWVAAGDGAPGPVWVASSRRSSGRGRAVAAKAVRRRRVTPDPIVTDQHRAHVRAVCRHARRAVRSPSGEEPRHRHHAAAPGIIARPVADLVGVVGPAVLAILCVVAAVRVRHRAADGTAPAAVGDGDAPNDEPPDDGQCGDVARALRQARKRRHSPTPTSLP